jgi:uncharacterized spore protein YtfJ
MGQGGGIIVRHARGLCIVSRDLLRNVAAGALPLSALRIAAASASGDDENSSPCGSSGGFGTGSACLSPCGFLVVLTTSSLSCAVLSVLHCVNSHPISSVMRYCIAASLARLRSVADAMIAFSTLVALLPKVISANKIQDWILALARTFGTMSRDNEVQRLIQGHIIHMMCQCDFFSVKSRQHINIALCQRMEYVLKGWKDAAQALIQVAPESVSDISSLRSRPSVCGKEWILLVMMRLAATHHVLRYMTMCLDANYQDVRFSRETPDGQQRFAAMQQCSNVLKNVLYIPLRDIFTILNTYMNVLSELDALHAQTRSDHVNHPVLSSLHRDVSELLTGALELIAKFSNQPSQLQSELQALVRRKLRSRSSVSAAPNSSSPALVTPTKGAGNGSNTGADTSPAAAALSGAEPDAVCRNMSSPPPPAVSAAASLGIRDDSPEFASACLRCASSAVQRCVAHFLNKFISFLALDRPYGGVVDWCVLRCLLMTLQQI